MPLSSQKEQYNMRPRKCNLLAGMDRGTWPVMVRRESGGRRLGSTHLPQTPSTRLWNP